MYHTVSQIGKSRRKLFFRVVNPNGCGHRFGQIIQGLPTFQRQVTLSHMCVLCIALCWPSKVGKWFEVCYYKGICNKPNF